MSALYRKICEKTFVCVITLSFLIAGCATEQINIPKQPADLIKPPAGKQSPEYETVLEKIRLRNKTFEDSPEWIKSSYEILRIRNLRNIPHRDYAQYGKYLDNGAVYIIVHPAFFPFFHVQNKFTDGSSFATENVVEKLLAQPGTDTKFALLQAQERRMRDFLEYKSTEKKLIIIVPLRDYKTYSTYVYKDGPDEYTRYLNEVTNDSESVVFIESGSSTRGYLKEEDIVRLTEFMLSVGAKRVFIGGSYVGRCVEDFYINFIKYYGLEGVYIVPEISDVSPIDVTPNIAMGLLLPDGSINIETATENLKTDVYQVQERPPYIINLP